MLRFSLRSFSQMFIPKSAVSFTPEGKMPLFEYSDGNIFLKTRYFIICSALTYLSLGYSKNIKYLIEGIFVASSAYYITHFAANERVKSMSLLQDGKNIEIVTFAKKSAKILPIEDISTYKSKDGANVIEYKKKKLQLSQEGKILDLDLFYAVLRKENIDVSVSNPTKID